MHFPKNKQLVTLFKIIKLLRRGHINSADNRAVCVHAATEQPLTLIFPLLIHHSIQLALFHGYREGKSPVHMGKLIEHTNSNSL